MRTTDARCNPVTRNFAPFALAAMAVALVTSRVGAQTPTRALDENERAVVMEAFSVRANPIENFGFQTQRSFYAGRPIVQVIAVIPNTAAAKAGLQPGDTVVGSDGKPVEEIREEGPFGADVAWRGFYVPPVKRLLLAKGMDVAWTLDVRSHPPTGATRQLTLALPTAPPRWGAKIWAAPQGRAPATVSESGPLAERAKLIMDNGVAIMLREDLAHNLPLRSYYFGFQWSVAEGRTFIVSQARNRTDIILQAGKTYFLTSPSGQLERVMRNEYVAQLDPWKEVAVAEALPAFQKEVEFWLHDVAKVSPRWPLELVPRASPHGLIVAPSAASPLAHGGPLAPPRQEEIIALPSTGQGAADFLRLPLPSPSQRMLFDDALGKIDSNEGRWAYTEIIDDTDARGRIGYTASIRAKDAQNGKGVTVVRVDPSKPEPERFTLLALNGKVPTRSETNLWRKREGQKRTLRVLGDLPPMARFLDLKNVRLVADDGSSTVFEVPVQPEKGLQFPIEMLQARVRMDKEQRSIVAIKVTTRAAAGAAEFESTGFGPFPLNHARVTVGLEVEFQTIDPAYPPQLVSLKLGGAGRVIFANRAGQDREMLRTDFRRVVP